MDERIAGGAADEQAESHLPGRGGDAPTPSLPDFQAPHQGGWDEGHPPSGEMGAMPSAPAPLAPAAPAAAGEAWGSPAASGASAPSAHSAAPHPSAQSAPPAPAPAAAPAATTAPSAAELGARLRAIGLENPLGSLVVGVAGYVGAVLVSFLSLLAPAIFAGAAAQGAGDELGLGTEAGEMFGSTVSFLLRMPFQMVHMAVFGSWGASVSVPGQGTMEIALRFVPLLTLLALVGLPFLGGRLLERFRPGGKLLGTAVSAVLTGFVVTVISSLAALITAFRLDVPEVGLKASFHAIGIVSVLLTFLLVSAALLLGRLSARPAPGWWPLVADLAAGLRLAALHAVTVALVVGAVMWIVTFVQAAGSSDGPGSILLVLLAVPLLAGPLLGLLAGWSLLSTVNVSASADLGLLSLGSGSSSEGASIFSLPWYVWLIVLVISFAVTALMALPWSYGRRIVPNSVVALGVSWLALPAAYFIGSLLLMAVAYTSFTLGVRASLFSTDTSGGLDMSIGLAAWTPLLALLTGCFVEVISRFLAPLVVGVLPPAALSWFRGGARDAAVAASPAMPAPVTEAAVAPQIGYGASALAPVQPAASAPPASSVSVSAPSGPAAGGAGTAASTVPMTGVTVPLGGAGALGAQEGASRVPMSKRAKRIILLVIALFAAAVIALVGAVVAVNVIGSTVFGPSKQVEEYLDALVAGDAAKATTLADPNVPTAQRVLLTDPVASKAKDRISSYDITDVEVDGKSAQVTAKLTQDGVSTTKVYQLERAGTAYIVFPEWRLQPVEYPTVQVFANPDSGKLIVNGTEVDFSGVIDEYGSASVPVLPGTYTADVEVPGDKVESVPASVKATLDGTAAPDPESFLAPSLALTDAGKKQVTAEVNKKLDECAEQTVQSPEGCPFSTWAFAEKGTWSIGSYPEIEITETEEDGFVIGTTKAGEATFTYTPTYSTDGKQEKDTVDVEVSGTVTFDATDGSVGADLNTW